MQENIHFYYTNDLHSNFKYWSRVTGFLKKEQEKKRLENKSAFIVDIGDHIDRVNPIAEAFMGKANVDLLNDADYDVVTIGNNEGITLAHEDLFSLYDQANFDVVCTNLQTKTGDNPQWLKSITKLHSLQGVTIGLLGLTAPFNAFYNLLNWHVTPPMQELRNHIDELHQTVDIIILLSHLGINEDHQIARNFPEIDVIIGGHTHHLLKTAETVNETIITAAGKYCAYVGEVILTWDHHEKRLINKGAYTANITHLSKDVQTEKKLADLTDKADKRLGKQIVQIKEPLDVDPFKNTLIIQQLTDTLKEWTKADCSMLNAGLLLDEFAAGPITYKDIHRVCPHPINPCVVHLRGDELFEVIRAAHTEKLTHLNLTGLGFRGKVIGKMIFSGLHIEMGTYKDGQHYVKEVLFKGEPLDRQQLFTVATVDMFTFGRLLPEIAKSPTKNYFLPEFIRDLLVETLKTNYQ